MPYTSLKLTNKILIIKIPFLNFSGEIKCGVGLSLVEVRFVITEDRRTGSDTFVGHGGDKAKFCPGFLFSIPNLLGFKTVVDCFSIILMAKCCFFK